MTATTDGSTGASLRPLAASASETDITIPAAAAGVPEAAARATRRATDFLLSQQDAQGWWKGDLETNVTMDAEDLLLRQFLGIQDAETTRAAALFIRGEQREDGTWATFYGGPRRTVHHHRGLRGITLAGDAPMTHPTWRGPPVDEVPRRHRLRPGLHPDLARPVRLVEMGRPARTPAGARLFPTWVPLNIYDFGCWARQTIVPLTIVSAKRPVRPAPFPLDELHTDPARPNPPRPLAPAASWDGAFQRIDKALHAYRKVAPRRLRRAAMNSAARWIIERQENDGCWGGIQPPAVYSVIALYLLGYDLEHPVMRAGLESLDRFAVWREDGARMIEACQSPVWDTCLATIALADAGVPEDHPQLVKASDWMLGEQIVRPGDWSVKRPGLPPGGWAFEFHNDNYPDIDDTAEVVLALRRVKHHDPERVEKAIGRGVRWNLGMQSKNGAWGAFDVDNTSSFPNRLPFCDFGEVIDPPSADVTAHVVEMLAVEGLAHDPRTRRGVQLAPGRAGGGRLVVRPLGRQLRLRHRVRDPRPDRGGTAHLAPGHPARGALAGVRPERGRRLGRGPALRPLRPAQWSGRGASTAVAGRHGFARGVPAGGRGCGSPGPWSAASNGRRATSAGRPAPWGSPRYRLPDRRATRVAADPGLGRWRSGAGPRCRCSR
ncbi:Squalene--hopene cyclase OS=Streptomyces tendae OX=1932 GN=shc PE=3 SV=1 [Streptomyces tendae]